MALLPCCCGHPTILHPTPASLPLSPANKREWFLPGEPITVTSAEKAAEALAQRGGGKGRLHPLPAIAVRRLLLLWSHTRETVSYSVRPPQARREDICSSEAYQATVQHS
ncbi:hypothetical protein ATANTOWER_000854 [Ataeniobius toweri]|uniref:Uncharacterized protein n=1 Tax=Ataeniobius toweri TaxID=208326 RepID=A0ABU7C521_9TELE|nr:hypothetical protein [Ataeniobius toweri]